MISLPESCLNDLFEAAIVQGSQNRFGDKLGVRKGSKSAHLQGNAVGVEIYFPQYSVDNRRKCQVPVGGRVEVVAENWGWRGMR